MIITIRKQIQTQTAHNSISFPIPAAPYTPACVLHCTSPQCIVHNIEMMNPCKTVQLSAAGIKHSESRLSSFLFFDCEVLKTDLCCNATEAYGKKMIRVQSPCAEQQHHPEDWGTTVEGQEKRCKSKLRSRRLTKDTPGTCGCHNSHFTHRLITSRWCNISYLQSRKDAWTKS